MPNYRANAVASTVQPRGGISIESVTSTFTVAVGLVANDTIALCKVPKDAVIQEVILSCSGSLGATLTGRLGDSGDDDRYIAAGTFGQGAASLKRLDAVAGHGYQYAADGELLLTINTAATPTTGEVITCSVIYSNQPKV
jgi:hypothetical protein